MTDSKKNGRPEWITDEILAEMSSDQKLREFIMTPAPFAEQGATGSPGPGAKPSPRPFIERAMRQTLNFYLPGWEQDPSTEGTARRFSEYLMEFAQDIDLQEIFGSTFFVGKGHHSIVLQCPIPFRMACEHHLLPALGTAALAYVPHERVIGLSKLTRLVQAVGVERPSLQERVADRIVDLMNEHLAPKGVMLVIRSEHTCMACRGVNAPGVFTTTSNVTGIFRDVQSAREEVLSLIQGQL